MYYFVLLLWFVVILGIIFVDVKKPTNYPPGPKWLPIVGSLISIIRLRKLLGFHHLVWHSLTEIYGPIVGLRLGRDQIIIVSNTEAVREVLTRDEFQGRPDGFFFRMRTFGERLGLVFSDGPLWQRQRKFAMQHLKQFGLGQHKMEEQITEEVKQFIENLKEKCTRPVNVHNMFDVGVINVLWAMIAGKRFQHNDHRLQELMDIIHEQFRTTDISGGLLNQLPWLRWICAKRSGYAQHASTLERLFSFLGETISEHQKKLCLNSDPRDLIDAFLQQMAQEAPKNETFTEKQLFSMCMDLFMAGSETTANTLEFVILYLVRNQKVQRKLQEELDNVIGKQRNITLADRMHLPYTSAVLNEVQRISHVAPVGIAHRATQDTFLQGYKVPQGTILLTNLYSMHTDASVWVDSHQFRPERFLKEDNICHFVPYGYGKRRCLGEALARANLFLVTATLFQKFSINVIADLPLPSLKPLDGVTLSPQPFQVIFTARN